MWLKPLLKKKATIANNIAQSGNLSERIYKMLSSIDILNGSGFVPSKKPWPGGLKSCTSRESSSLKSSKSTNQSSSF